GNQSEEVELSINEYEEQIISDVFSEHIPNYIYVKYRNTPVDIAAPYFEYLNTYGSSFINGAWYDAENKYMIIRLNGVYYDYCGIPIFVWQEFKNATSFGSYFNYRIKWNYDCRDNYV
ncbi:KTSC domain-containing protein, partial [Arthrospira platensis SPKY1]|nr:KTSC domain-containing protein [Arthrospira platensis SPKY1]